jgi:hypothetical protein
MADAGIVELLIKRLESYETPTREMEFCAELLVNLNSVLEEEEKGRLFFPVMDLLDSSLWKSRSVGNKCVKFLLKVM